MKYVNLLIVALAIQFAVHFATADQTNFLSQPRIIGGSAKTIRDVPFLLSFHMKRRILCGGVIISRSWGLTALHCIILCNSNITYGYQKHQIIVTKPETSAENYVARRSSIKESPKEEDYFARAGSTLNFDGGSTYPIKKFYSYNSTTPHDPLQLHHDILLFSVKKRFPFNDWAHPAKLPVEGTESPNSLQVSGWGLTSAGTHPYVISTVNVTKVTIEECLAATPAYVGTVTEKLHLCYGGKNADACDGDSGGPLADSQTVYGIVSYDVGCGKHPGVYTKVSFYRQWIKQIAEI